MNELINGYTSSCTLVRQRIAELTAQRRELAASGNYRRIESLDLERRIRLLYTEHCQMKEIIDHLTAYTRRVGRRGDT